MLIIDKNPYGILVDTYKYCQYLQNQYDITYVCIDYGYPKLDSGRVKVKYTLYTRNKLFRGIVFTIMSLYYVLISNGFIYISYYPGCGLLKKIVFWKKMHIDVRTLSVASDPIERERWNNSLRDTIRKFDTISCISEGVKKLLYISGNKKVYVIPLGADVISSCPKSFEKLNLLYVGTLNNRRIIDTVIGFHDFLKKHKDEDPHYIIIGDGEEFEMIKQYVIKYNLESKIELKGKIPYTELKPYFDCCNVGVSYVPITDYYQYQPPTKTFEYIMSGLYCMATSTFENSRVITPINGVLFEDSSIAFCNALDNIYLNRHLFDSGKIKKTLTGYLWHEIVTNYFVPLLDVYFKQSK